MDYQLNTPSGTSAGIRFLCHFFTESNTPESLQKKITTSINKVSQPPIEFYIDTKMVSKFIHDQIEIAREQLANGIISQKQFDTKVQAIQNSDAESVNLWMNDYNNLNHNSEAFAACEIISAYHCKPTAFFSSWQRFFELAQQSLDSDETIDTCQILKKISPKAMQSLGSKALVFLTNTSPKTNDFYFWVDNQWLEGYDELTNNLNKHVTT